MIRLVGLCGLCCRQDRVDRHKVAETPVAGKVEGLSEHSEAGLDEPSELPSSRASCAPWSAGNNCTDFINCLSDNVTSESLKNSFIHKYESVVNIT